MGDGRDGGRKIKAILNEIYKPWLSSHHFDQIWAQSWVLCTGPSLLPSQMCHKAHSWHLELAQLWHCLSNNTHWFHCHPKACCMPRGAEDKLWHVEWLIGTGKRAWWGGGSRVGRGWIGVALHCQIQNSMLGFLAQQVSQGLLNSPISDPVSFIWGKEMLEACLAILAHFGCRRSLFWLLLLWVPSTSRVGCYVLASCSFSINIWAVFQSFLKCLQHLNVKHDLAGVRGRQFSSYMLHQTVHF